LNSQIVDYITDLRIIIGENNLSVSGACRPQSRPCC